MTMTESEVRMAKWHEERDAIEKALDDAASHLTKKQREVITNVWNLLDEMEENIRECFDLDMRHARQLSLFQFKMRDAFPALCQVKCMCE
jgi:hypothetical protein|tara:strand:- start:688 stop:957 length:270 start_codon:yes stop_codon:yes gene_type:complete